MTEEMKENRCDMIFYCEHSVTNPCVYRVDNEEDTRFCKYEEHNNKSYWCMSIVAKVNAMVLRLKKAGLTKGEWIDE